MSRALLFRILVSVAVLACFSRAIYLDVANPPTGQLPFGVEPQGAEFVVHAVPGVPLPPPLAEGQIVDLTKMGLLDRAALFNRHPLPVGTRATVVVRQQGRLLGVPAVAARAPPAQLEELQRWVGGATVTFMLAVALLTLWRGRDATAWGLCFFFSGLVIRNGALFGWVPPLLSLWLNPVDIVLQSLELAGLYVMAECLAGKGLPRAWLVVTRLAGAGSGAGVAALLMIRDVFLRYQGAAPPAWLGEVPYGALVAVLTGIPVLTLLAGYRGASEASRRRMRWVLMSTALLVGSVLVGVVTDFSPSSQPLLYITFASLLPGLAILGYLYGILSARVVDVTFVVDRALAFSVTTALLFGMFSLLEQTVHRLALGEELGWLVQAAGAVMVAALLSPLHRLLDRGLERVFFHKLRTIASALRKCAEESVFYEKGEVLLARALKQLLVPCAAVAIYERSTAVYQRRLFHGEHWPEAVDADDPAFISLRAHPAAVDLKGLESVAGAEGLGFPMKIGQLLTGAVIVRLREGEQLDRDVRAAITELARALGTSLYLMRSREQERLLTEIAADLAGDKAIRNQAAALLGRS